MDPFWMVYGMGQGAPKVRHPTEAAAIREAERLARNQPGIAFVVLEAIGAALKHDVERINIGRGLSPRPSHHDLGDDIPF